MQSWIRRMHWQSGQSMLRDITQKCGSTWRPYEIYLDTAINLTALWRTITLTIALTVESLNQCRTWEGLANCRWVSVLEVITMIYNEISLVSSMTYHWCLGLILTRFAGDMACIASSKFFNQSWGDKWNNTSWQSCNAYHWGWNSLRKRHRYKYTLACKTAIQVGNNLSHVLSSYQDIQIPVTVQVRPTCQLQMWTMIPTKSLWSQQLSQTSWEVQSVIGIEEEFNGMYMQMTVECLLETCASDP